MTESLHSFAIVETSPEPATTPEPVMQNWARLMKFGLTPDIPSPALPGSSARQDQDPRTPMRRLVELNAANPLKLPKDITHEETAFVKAYLDERKEYVENMLRDIEDPNTPATTRLAFMKIGFSKAEFARYVHSLFDDIKTPAPVPFVILGGDGTTLPPNPVPNPLEVAKGRLSPFITNATKDQLIALKESLKENLQAAKKGTTEEQRSQLIGSVSKWIEQIDAQIK